MTALLQAAPQAMPVIRAGSDTGISTGWLVTLVGLAVSTIIGGGALLRWALVRQVAAMDKSAEGVAALSKDVAEAVKEMSREHREQLQQMHDAHAAERKDWQERQDRERADFLQVLQACRLPQSPPDDPA